MGTRGLWGFKHRGKYYLFENGYNSDQLGVTLALMVPRDPDELREWLVTTRRDLTGLAQRLEQAWTVSIDSPAETKHFRSIAGAETLCFAPGHVRPGGGVYPEPAYVIDLDSQTLVFNNDNVCHFHLDKLPDVKTLVSLTQPANRYWLGLDPEPADACITTDVAMLPPIADDMSAEVEYAALEPLPMPEITMLDDKTEALVSTMGNIHQFVCNVYSFAITQALETCSAESHLFRELCYLFLGVACCSPERLRLANVISDACSKHSPRMDRDLAWNLCLKYGILSSGGSGDLVSTFLSDYHEAGKAPGSAPPDTSYWVGPVLVRLECDLSCRTRFRAAISAAAHRGRAEKQEFRAVVFSLRHFVLIHVSPLGVRHSKRHHLLIGPPHVGASDDDMLSPPSAAMDLLDHGGPGDQDWSVDETCDGFRALARFMILSSSEINRSLDEFSLGEPLELIRRAEGEADVLQGDGIGRGESFYRLWAGRPEEPEKDHVCCIVVLAAGSKTSTASFLAVPVPCEPVPPRPVATITVPEPVLAHAEWSRNMLNRLGWLHVTNEGPFIAQWRRWVESDHTNWALLDALLASPDGHLIPRHVPNLVVFYGLVFFLPSGIAGSGGSLYSYANYLGQARPGQLARQSLESHVQIVRRSEGRTSSIYFVALYRPASDDSVEGWARAEKEARKQAELEYIREAFRLWIDKKDTTTHDLAVYIIVGTKLKVLHVTKHPQVPTMDQAPPDPGQSLEKSSCYIEDPFWRPWEGTSISPRDLRAQLEFGPVDAMFQNREGAVDEHLGHLQPRPFDVQDIDDRPAIDAALAWTQMLANSRGQRLFEQFAAPHPYHM
ncbi:hypothetical protein MAPG_09640 [Magnaporthiopsis poae ATCC 64411]|uniref:Uncharacterized protein n=1 Tax=Magnaporthiopsis poae (strain ATCC 64411 / 73-15) TaxID=644358 RepID=A0A0C4EAH0_MAGP6|nr:hypothetical protein MAPG_09640 [Magnaporthiopsis poae ATCC 64411]